MPASFVDEVFGRVATARYTRKLLFSTLVRLLGLVVCRVRSAVRASIQAMAGDFCVSSKRVYNKVNGAETAVAEAKVDESAARMSAVVSEVSAPLAPLVTGCHTRILNGNYLAATDHRSAAQHTIGGDVLPGLALVVYDAERALVDRVYLCEDGHAQERELPIELLGKMAAGEA